MDRKYMEAPGAGRFAMRLGMRNYLEILEPVVIFYTIAVMNPLLSIKNTAKMLLHNETMLKYVTNFIPMWMLGRHNFYFPPMNLNSPPSPIRTSPSFQGETPLLHGFNPSSSQFISPISPQALFKRSNYLRPMFRSVFPSELGLTQPLYPFFCSFVLVYLHMKKYG